MPPTISTTNKIPQTIPALNIPPTTSQLDKNSADSTAMYKIEFFINNFIKDLQILFHVLSQVLSSFSFEEPICEQSILHKLKTVACFK